MPLLSTTGEVRSHLDRRAPNDMIRVIASSIGKGSEEDETTIERIIEDFHYPETAIACADKCAAESGIILVTIYDEHGEILVTVHPK